MGKFTEEQVLRLSNSELSKEIDELIRRFDDIEDDTADLLTALVAKKKAGTLVGIEANAALQCVLLLLDKARKFKSAMELVVGGGNSKEKEEARKEVQAAIKTRSAKN